MKKFIYLSGYGSLIFIFLNQAIAQPINQNICSKSWQVYNTVSNYHFNGRMNSLEFNERVVNELIKSLDYYGVLFTHEELAKIKGHKNKMNIDMIFGTCSFPSAIFEIYRDRILVFDSIMSDENLWDNSFDEIDSIRLLSRIAKNEYAANDSLLSEKIRRRIKYMTLLEYQSSLDTLAGTFIDFENKKPELIANIQALERCRMSHFYESEASLAESFMDEYMKAIASSYDPHTNYMSISEMNEFEFSLSEEIYSTGLMIEETRMGVYMITGKIPGSTASDMTEISEGDEVLKISFNDEEIHPSCLEIKDFYGILNNPTPKEVKMTLRKQNGSVVKVNIAKTLIDNISNEIGALVLENDIRVGYLALPSFYRSMDDPKSNSAADIAEQVEKFKSKNTDGLIIDLRFNGGGSVLEAVELASLFLTKGPLIQEVSREKKVVLKDLNKDQIYSGNIILLVNAVSASAAEMFVSMMHAHNRALIVGNQTYGKATGQLMGPMMLEGSPEAYGALKLTVLRYYDLSGKTFQRKGFTPDIIVPDGLPDQFFSEDLYEYALPQDVIDKKIKIKKKKQPQIPIATLRTKSEARQNQNPVYGELRDYKDSLNTVLTRTYDIPLDLMGFLDKTKFVPFDSTRYNYVVNEDFKLEVVSGLTQFGGDSEKQLVYEIGTDPSIREAINIMKDWHAITQ